MPWSDPDKGKSDNPWAKRSPPNANPDLDAMLARVKQFFAGLFGGGDGGGKGAGGASPLGGGLPYLVGVLVVVWGLSGFYVVDSDEQGIVLRFGQYVATQPPGLHYRLPYPIDTVQTPKVAQSRRIEIGFRSMGEGIQKMPSEGLMLTRDENIVDISFAVQYRISDAPKYLFNARDPESIVRQVAESAIRETVGRSKIDEVMTEGRALVEQRTQEVMQEILNRYEIGIVLDAVRLQEARPPEQVLPAFLDVTSAREDMQRARNEAEAYANDVVPRARGEASRVMAEASGYKQRVIDQALGDASRFRMILAEYKRAPGVTRERLYLETMEEIFGNATKVIVDSKKGNNMLYLPLDKWVRDQNQASPAPEPIEPKSGPSAQAQGGQGMGNARAGERTP